MFTTKYYQYFVFAIVPVLFFAWPPVAFFLRKKRNEGRGKGVMRISVTNTKLELFFFLEISLPTFFVKSTLFSEISTVCLARMSFFFLDI
jgi:hypothetical protein